MNFEEFIKPELMVLIPVLCLIGAALKKSAFVNKYIPLTLGGVSIVLSALWVFATCGCQNAHDVIMGVFTAVTQGVLVAGASVYAHQIYKHSKEGNKNE